MIIQHVWHFSGERSVPGHLREVPIELSENDIASLSLLFDVLIYRDDGNKIVLALDQRGKKFRQR